MTNDSDRLMGKVRRAGAFDGRSLLICAPTNTGKSYIAQKLVLHYVENQDLGYTSVYLCPFKALAEEIALSLEEKIRARIQEAETSAEVSSLRYKMPVLSTGDYAEPVDFSTVPLLVATYEKFAALISKRRDFRPYVVVADEVQLVGDETRGARAEFLIASLIERETIGQKVLLYALSAVIGNSKQLSDWLQLPLVQGDDSDRFVPLTIRSACVHEKDAAADFIHRTVLSEVRDRKQVLILDPSARGFSEKRAEGLKEVVGRLLSKEERSRADSLAAQLVLIAPYLRPLAELVREGVAYHHAGLELEARRLIERAFRRDGVPKVICCSPTLAAGVNLPAARVILRNPVFQGIERRPLTPSECLNMLGRAGRYIPQRKEQHPGVANICLTAKQKEECAATLEAVEKRQPGNVRSQIPTSLSHVMDFVLWSIQLRGAKTVEGIIQSYVKTLWAAERGAKTPVRTTGRLRDLVAASLNTDGKLDELRIHKAAVMDGAKIVGAVRSSSGIYEIEIPPAWRPRCNGPQRHPADHCKHVRKLLLSGLTPRKDATLPIAAFDAAMRLVPEFGVNMPPERVLQFATEILAEWQFLEEGPKGYDVTEDGRIAAASWLPKSMLYQLRERVLAAEKDAKIADVITWAFADVLRLVDLNGLEDGIGVWLRGAPPDQIVACLKGTRGYQDFLSVRDHLVTILRTYAQYAQAHEKTFLIKPLTHATRKVQHGVPDDGLPLACAMLKSLNRDRLLTLYQRGIKSLDQLAAIDPGTVVLPGETGDRSKDAIEEARARLAKIRELTAMSAGAERERRIRQLTSEFGMDLDDFHEFLLGEARK